MQNKIVNSNLTNRPLITIVIPFYNSFSKIMNSLSSIKKQNFKNFNIIFVDDGSTIDADKTLELISRELGDFFQYKIIKQENAGQGAARNAGVNASDGEWIYFLDADDSFSPDLFNIFKQLNLEKYNFIFTKFSLKNKENVQLFKDVSLCKTKEYNKEKMLNDFLKRKIIPLVPGSFYRRSFLLERNIFHENIRWSEDQLFVWKVLFNCELVLYLDNDFYHYFTSSDGSIMASTAYGEFIKSLNVFRTFVNSLNDSKIKKCLIGRWILGCLHILAKRHDLNSFLKFYVESNAKDELNKIKREFGMLIFVLSSLGEKNSKILYNILKSL